MDTFKRIRNILSAKEKRRFTILLFVILIMGLLEVVGLASILPFIQLVADPSIIESNGFLNSIYVATGLDSHRQMLVLTGVAVIGLIVFVNLFAIMTNWLTLKYNWDAAHALSTRLLSVYLHNPYQYFLDTNSAYIASYVVAEVATVVKGVILNVIAIISRGFVILILFSLLLVVDIKVALTMFVILAGAYVVIFLIQRKFLKTLGEDRIKFNTQRFKSLLEAFRGIKTVMVYDKKELFEKNFAEASYGFSETQPKLQMALSTPRHLLEILAFSAIVCVTIYLYTSSGNFTEIVPKLTLYALAGYRLIPALQQVFSAAGSVRNSIPALDKVYDDLVKFKDLPKQDALSAQVSKINGDIQLTDITFTYPGSDGPALSKINLSIRKGEKIAFVGTTGSGKTTLVDLLLGLHQPDSGVISVGDSAINKQNLRNWRASVAYVSQDIFLFDDQLDNNIAFAKNQQDVDQDRLKEVLKIADLADFVSTLPDGLKTVIGENGVRLSGGQKQRIGLARALFTSPDVLILDEATSALDNTTEKGIIDSLALLPKDITTIIIAHRLSTVRDADRIFLLEKGQIKDHGRYEQLIDSSETFREMAHLTQN